MTTGRGYKRELTINGGLMTPDSFASASEESRSTVTPKRDESIDLTSINEFQDPRLTHDLLHTHDGLPGPSSMISAPASFAYPNHIENAESDSMSTETVHAGEGLKVLGHDVNRLISLIDKLRRIGLKDVDGKLPELVLVGDQSAGKSSLMGAIAEINLPKSNSTCTRCPYNIKTSPAQEWECTVSLEEDHDYNPSWRQQPFPKWQRREGTISRLFKTISDKGELEEVLTWAQIALLNPSKDLETFVPGSREQQFKKNNGDENIEVQYSPNVIAVAIRGPGLPALSFFDLPGLIQNTGLDELQFLIKVFDELTIKYIKHESAIIICTLSMANDAQLSKTKGLIGKYKADHKCIGVLTKPDTMQGEAASHSDFDGIFRGTSHVLPRGYYVTKQPGPDSRLIKTSPHYHALARQEEEAYFNESPHWGLGGAWYDFRDRCGTSVIQKYLSKEFARQILASIPDLEQNIKAQTREVDQELAKLPEVANDQVQYTVRHCLTQFTSKVDAIFSGAANDNQFLSDWTKLCTQFLKAIEIQRPGCRCSHPSDSISEVIVIDDSETESIVSHRPSTQVTPGSAKRQRENADEGSANRTNINKRQRLNDGPIPLHLGTPRNRIINTPSRPKTEPGVMRAAPGIVGAARSLTDEEIGPFKQPYLSSGHMAMSIEDIQKAIKKFRKPGFPDFVNPKVMEEAVLQAIHAWEGPLQTFMIVTFSMLRQQILSALSLALQKHQQTELYKRSREHIEELLTEHEEEQRKILLEFYYTESRNLFTINTEAFNRYKAEALEALKARRRQDRVIALAEKRFGKPSRDDADTHKEARRKFMEGVKDEQLGPDKFEQELDVAAFIRGYYTTARFRFTDSVCSNMHTRYFKTIGGKLIYFLEIQFRLDHNDSEETCRMLLEGNPDIPRQRAHFRNRKKQLAEFSQTLDELKNDTFAADVPRSYSDLGDGGPNFGGGESPDLQNGSFSFRRG